MYFCEVPVMHERGVRNIFYTEERVNYEGKAAVTVFLSVLFLLFFSMIGLMFDRARILSSDGYMKVAARSAAMTVFGDFNKELFEEYGLFAYGGYDGIGITELGDQFFVTLEENLRTAPNEKGGAWYDLYRFRELTAQVLSGRNITEEEIFYEQIEGFLKQHAVEEMADKLTGKVQAEKSGSAVERLKIAGEYEAGKYEPEEEREKGEEDYAEKGRGDESVEREKENQAKKEREKTEKKKLSEDAAGGNPFKAFSKLTGSGILSLVCDEKKLSDKSIEVRQVNGTEGSGVPERQEENVHGIFDAEKDKESGAAGYLGKLIRENDDSTGALEGDKKHTAKKAKLLLYAGEQFSDYTDNKKKTAEYGLEYLAAGKQEEQENLSTVVKRILVMRLLTNLTYVLSSPELQAKSMETATILAGFTGLVPVIQAVQYTILLILAFEEACIDVTALLEGRTVPAGKNASNFKMHYEEICIATKGLFKQKAGLYPKKEGKSGKGICYQEYLKFFLLFQKEAVLRERTADLIQYDLRKRFNESFCIDEGICAAKYRISYRVDGFFSSLPLIEVQRENGYGIRKQEVDYDYKS